MELPKPTSNVAAPACQSPFQRPILILRAVHSMAPDMPPRPCESQAHAPNPDTDLIDHFGDA